MIVLLSPAKTLNTEPSSVERYSQPQFIKESETLVTILKEKSAADLKKLMKISDKIADLNVVRYKSFSTPFELDNAKQAIFAFRGDVYTGLHADSFDNDDLEFAQQHIRILSGLYGILKPLDLMQPYRLEMGTKLANSVGKNLYEFWDEKITKEINSELKKSKSKLIVNLASNEYFHSVKLNLLEGDLLNVNFKELRDGKYKIISFSAKKARGMMSHYIVKNRIETAETLKGFDIDNYVYNEELSDEKNYIFTR